MKKNFLLVSMAMFALVSCSNDEILEVNQNNTIKFTSLTQKSTRAGFSNTNRPASIKVFGSNSNGAVVGSVAGTNTNFVEVSDDQGKTNNYDTGILWPTGSEAIKFTAYAPSDLPGTISAAHGGNFTVVDFAQTEKNAKNHKDFIAAYKESQEVDKVALNFKHALSKVTIALKNTGNKFDVSVAGVALGRVNSKGNFEMKKVETNAALKLYSQTTPAAWTSQDVKVTYGSFKDDVVTLSNSVTTFDDSFLIVPQELDNWNLKEAQQQYVDNGGVIVKVLIKVNAKNGAQLFPDDINQYGWVAVPIKTGGKYKFEASKKYTFTLDFANGAGNSDPDKNNNPNLPEDTNGGGTKPNVNVDNTPTPKEPGTPVLGNNTIKFTVSVEDWETGEDVNIDMN